MSRFGQLGTLLTLYTTMLVACGTQPSVSSAPPTPDTGSVSITNASTSVEDQSALLEAAKAEGKVTVYSFTSRIEQVEKAFEAAYPQIDLVAIDISSTEQITRLKAEQAAGVREADVAYISDAPAVLGELVQKGYLEQYVPAQFVSRVPKEFQQPLIANRLSTKVLMYNEESHPQGSPVTNLWELTQPQWRAKVVMVDPLVRDDYLDLMTEIVLRSDEMERAYQELTGTSLVLKDGVRSAGEQWIRDLYANEVILVEDTDAVNVAVGKKGQPSPPVGFASYSDRRDNEEEGWALQIANTVSPAPGIVFPALLGIVKDAPHPAAARVLIQFMMGDDSPTGGPGYAPFYVPGDYATRTDIRPHADAIPLQTLRAWRIQAAQTFEQREAVKDLLLSLQ
jgi:iron(III) transport system substrate-binding protein